MSEKSKKSVKFAVSLLVAAAFLYFAFRGLDWRAFLNGLDGTDWWYILASMAAAYMALIFRAERWRLQLVTLDSGISRGAVWHGSNLGNLMSLAIPGIGEFYRCAHVNTPNAGYDRTFGTIIMERAWDVAAIAALFALAVFGSAGTLEPFMKKHILEPFTERFNISFRCIAILLFLAAAISVFLVWKFRDRSRLCRKCIDAASGIVKGFTAFGSMPRKSLFIVYTVAIWTMYVFMTYYTFLAVPGLEDLTFADAVFISAIGNIASVIPTPGNMGAYHYLVGMAISSVYARSWETGLLCATLSHGSHAALLVFLALISYCVVKFKRK